MGEIHYIYSLEAPGGSERQLKLLQEKEGAVICETGTMPRKILKIIASLRSARPNTTHIFWLSADQFWGALAFRITRVDGAIGYAIRNDPLRPFVSPRSWLYERLAFRFQVDEWISNSSGSLRLFEARYGEKYRRAFVKKNLIRNGSVRWERGSLDPVNLIYVGHPNKYKGFDRLVALLQTNFGKDNVKVSCFGFKLADVPRVWKRSITELNCEISFEIDDLWYSRKFVNGLLINLSRTEGLPSAPLEALGHGIPVLVPNFLPYSQQLSPEYVYTSWHTIDDATVTRVLDQHQPTAQILE